MSSNLKLIYQLKVTLHHSKPPIWRRIQVQADTRLDLMHEILQVVMGWENYHLHQFIIYDDYYGEPHDDYMDFLDMKDQCKFNLSDFQMEAGIKFIYEYDFGDSWEHILLLEKILPEDTDTSYPVCLKGRRACPPEDIGGIWGYEDFLDAISNPDHEMHEEYREYYGGDFNPEFFNLEGVNKALKQFR